MEPDERNALVIADRLEGMAVADIAAKWGLTVSQAKRILSQASPPLDIDN